MSSDEPATRPYPDCPLAVAYGLGVDSTAMLIEFVRRGIRPDLGESKSACTARPAMATLPWRC